MLKMVMIVGCGGAGSALRYALAGWGQRFGNGTFPLGTLLVNVLGCLLIGLLAAAFNGPFLIREEYRVAILVGLLGGFTTFSAFAWETLTLATDGQWARAAANILLSNGLGLLAAWLGYRVALKAFGV